MPPSLSTTTLCFRIYQNWSKTQYNVFSTADGREYRADQAIEDLVNAELSNEENGMNKKLYLQHPPECLGPLFTVEFPERAQRFILDSTNGITLWYNERLYKDQSKKDVSRRYKFPSERLESISWTMNNLLVYLQRAHLCLPLQSPGLGYSSDHYPVNILLRIGDSPNDPETKFMTLFVSGDTKLVNVFEILAKENVENWYALFQWVWNEEKGKYDVPIRWYYDDAREQNVAFKYCGWVDDAIVWLRLQSE